MAKIISVFNGKGGVGKTTTSICLYEAYNRGGVNVCIVDADVQKSVLNLVKIMDLPIKVYALEDVKGKIGAMKEDLIIIDSPPYLRMDSIRQLPKSDIIIIPCKPSPVDALSTLQTIRAMGQFKLISKCYVLFTMMRANNPYLEKMKEAIQAYNVPSLKSQIFYRIAYNKALGNGSLYAQRDKKAIEEIEALSQEIFNKITR